MREQITFENVTTQEQWDKLKEFAASDGHVLTDTSLLPVVTMKRGNKMFGYFHVHKHPIIMPAFNRKECSPRDFKDAVEQVSATMRLNSMDQRFPNGTAFIAFDDNPAISEDIIARLGFKNINRHIWQQGGV